MQITFRAYSVTKIPDQDYKLILNDEYEWICGLTSSPALHIPVHGYSKAFPPMVICSSGVPPIANSSCMYLMQSVAYLCMMLSNQTCSSTVVLCATCIVRRVMNPAPATLCPWDCSHTHLNLCAQVIFFVFLLYNWDLLIISLQYISNCPKFEKQFII